MRTVDVEESFKRLALAEQQKKKETTDETEHEG
jgi:hypothetical protein